MSHPAPERIYQPNMRDEKTGLYCFFDKERACGPDCMAWSRPPAAPDFKDQQWASCVLLVNAHRLGKHAVVLASQGMDLLKHLKVKSADDARNNQPPPPVPK